MLTLSRDDVATKPRQQIQNKKFMFTIIWNPTGFYVVDRLPNDIKMNSDYFVTNVLTSLEQTIFPCRRTPHEKRLMISADNCSVHPSRGSRDWLEKHGIQRMPDQLYSPNLATSDLYLFCTLKEKLERIHLSDDDQFFEGFGSTRIDSRISGLGAPSSRSQRRQWRLHRMINRFYL
jgi:hypothetical protein